MLHRNLYISKILPIKTRNEKKNTLLMLYLKLLDIPMMYTIVKFTGFDAVLERITVGFFDKFS